MNSTVAEARVAILYELTGRQRRYVKAILAGATKYAVGLAAGYSRESARNAKQIIEREAVVAAIKKLIALAELDGNQQLSTVARATR